MKDCKKVSIVLPTYNGADYISESIDSCLNQTYKNIELIIVNDASIDNTEEIIKKYDDNRIIYIKNETNKGLPHALNIGFAKVSGDYLTWTSDDNVFNKNAMEVMLGFLIDNKADFVYCNYYCFTENDKSDAQLIKLPQTFAPQNGNNIGACFLYAREVKESVGDYDEKLFLAEDYDYWIRIYKKYKICHINKPLYYYRNHQKSLYSINTKKVVALDLLVKVKNDIASIEDVLKVFFANRADKKISKYFNQNNLLKKLLKKIYKYYLWIFYKSKVNRILNDYKSNKIQIREAEEQLCRLIDVRL